MLGTQTALDELRIGLIRDGYVFQPIDWTNFRLTIPLCVWISYMIKYSQEEQG